MNIHPVATQKITVRTEAYKAELTLSLDTALELYEGGLHTAICEFVAQQKRHITRDTVNLKALEAMVEKLEELGFTDE